MRSYLLALAALFLIALPGLADPPQTALQIEVKTHSGKPVERASVVVKFVRGRNYVAIGKKMHTTWQLKTNQEGIAKVPSIPQGDILIQVIAKGYQTYGETFDVNEAEKTIEIKLNPPQPQVSAHQ